MSNKVIQIVPEDVSVFAKELDSALGRASTGESVSLSGFGGYTMVAGQAMAMKRMNQVAIGPCDVVFRAGGIEYDEWAAGLLLMARSAEFLRRKARDGQCYTHERPCAAASDVELEVYRACLDSFQSLLDALKSRGIEDPD
jgi:hypothetical protein